MSQVKLKKISKKGRQDYYFFCKHILGYSKMSEKPHKELCDFVTTSPKRKKMILMPRGSFKSSVVTIGYTMWSLVNNPNLRVMIASETQKNARKFVKECRAHFESNQKFRACYGNWVPNKNTWRDDEFIVEARELIKKDPSVMAASLEKQVTTGMHFDYIILDDPISLNNINTTDQIRKTIDFYKMLLSVLEPDGKIIVIGTRYSAMDLYGYLQDDDSPEYGEISILIKEAEDDEGNLLMPEVLSRDFLNEQKRSQGSWMYSCQYLNKAVSAETCFFSEQHIRFYKQNPPGLYYFMSVDPAISKNQRSDYTGIIINGVDFKNRWYIQEALEGKFNPAELVDKIIELFLKYEPVLAIGMEKFALEQVLKVSLLAEQDKRNIALPLVDIPTDTRISKEARIRALQPKFQNGEIFMRKEQMALRHQVLNYPLGVKHDDLLDALKSQLKISFASDHVYDEDQKPKKKLEQIEIDRREDLKRVYRVVNRKKRMYV